MKYRVRVYETLKHSVLVEADTADDAVQEAYDLISNHTEGYLVENHDYDADAEYQNYYEIDEED